MSHRFSAKSSIVILTGAGISAESGIKTFRDANGLWENHAIEDVATPEAFEHNPTLVQRFYNARRAQLVSGDVLPNVAHLALAELERRWPGDVFLVTQNVDDLHDRAGSRRLLHMHGELLKVRCVISDEVFEWRHDLTMESTCSCCGKPGRLRPHIVWFGEMPIGMDLIYETLDECDLFLSIGTSGQVYPAAGFVSHVRGRARTVEINLEPSHVHTLFDETIHGPAGIEVPKFVAQLLREAGV